MTQSSGHSDQATDQTPKGNVQVTWKNTDDNDTYSLTVGRDGWTYDRLIDTINDCDSLALVSVTDAP